MLTSKLYTAMKDGPALNIPGRLKAGEHFWNVAVFLQQRTDGRWRLGNDTDSEIYVLNHIHASIPPRHGPNRTACARDKRDLLRQIYEFIDGQTGYAPEIASTVKAIPVSNRRITMQCEIITKRGTGPRCPNQAADGQTICKTHVFLLAKLGDLPRVAADAVMEVVTKVQEAIVPLAEVPMVARMTPGMMTGAAMEEPGPVEQSTEKPKRVKKTSKASKKVNKSPLA